MSKLKEIWQIIKRKDLKDGDEVHIQPFNGGFMVSDKLYQKIKLEIEETPTNTHIGDLYGVKLISTPILPYIYKKANAATKPEEN